jgi:hypothetical protein
MSDDLAHILDVLRAARAIGQFLKGVTTVALRVTDMLGEEVLVTKTV